ncbi:MAG: sigma-70 family RNA polymerase sigma factor [Bacteroidota bacterium]
MPPSDDLTRLLGDLSDGNQAVVDELLPQVYEELRAIARRQLRGERAGHTLDTVALVNEAYLKLVGGAEIDWQNRAHFFGMAALAMRRILINYAHQRRAEKRGGGQALATFNDEVVSGGARADQLIALDEALTRLEAWNARQATVVTYRFFGGLTHEEVAAVLGVSVSTVRSDWRMARAWLRRELDDDTL